MTLAGPVVNCLDRSVYGPLAGRETHACPRCGGYHNANGGPLIGPCPTPGCPYVSQPGGMRALDCPCGGKVRLEVHEHSRIAGTGLPRIKHSHAGPVGIEHAGYGPASLTVDRSEWLHATGLRGGGTKRFTVRPTGPQP